jgi:hypothetical protein
LSGKIINGVLMKIYLWMILFTFCQTTWAKPKPCEFFCQLTGTQEGDFWYRDPFPGSQFADPSAPRFLQDENALEITGSGFHSARWYAHGRRSAWNRMLAADTDYEWFAHRLYSPDGNTEIEAVVGGRLSNVPWDMTIEKWPEYGNEEVLYASVMTPADGENHAYFPQDNKSRRVFAFEKRADGIWKRSPEPLLGTDPLSGSWVGHNYGHDFVKLGDQGNWVFFEMVSEERDGLPWKTEIFVQQLKNPYQTAGEPIKVLGLPNSPWPASHRKGGGFLIEGPRVVRIEGAKVHAPFFLMGFSTGEFSDDSYKLHFAYSESVTGPFEPVLTDDGTDLEDFSQSLRERFELSRGPGRPVVFQDPHGNWWCVVHAIDATASDESDDANPIRHIYLMRLSMEGDSPEEVIENLRAQFLELPNLNKKMTTNRPVYHQPPFRGSRE